MAFDERLADRIRAMLDRRRVRFSEKRMFGGLCFLVDDKMMVGVEKNRLMARIDPDDEVEALRRPGTKPMDFTGKVMKGYVFINNDAVDMDNDLEYWLALTLKFNPKAKASKKKTSKLNVSMNNQFSDPNDPMSGMGDMPLMDALSNAAAAPKKAARKAKKAVRKAKKAVKKAAKKAAVKKVAKKAVKKAAAKKVAKKAAKKVAKKAAKKAAAKKVAKKAVKKAAKKAARKAAGKKVAKKAVKKAAKKVAGKKVARKAAKKAAPKKAARRRK